VRLKDFSKRRAQSMDLDFMAMTSPKKSGHGGNYCANNYEEKIRRYSFKKWGYPVPPIPCDALKDELEEFDRCSSPETSPTGSTLSACYRPLAKPAFCHRAHSSFNGGWASTHVDDKEETPCSTVPCTDDDEDDSRDKKTKNKVINTKRKSAALARMYRMQCNAPALHVKKVTKSRGLEHKNSGFSTFVYEHTKETYHSGFRERVLTKSLWKAPVREEPLAEGVFIRGGRKYSGRFAQGNPSSRSSNAAWPFGPHKYTAEEMDAIKPEEIREKIEERKKSIPHLDLEIMPDDEEMWNRTYSPPRPFESDMAEELAEMAREEQGKRDAATAASAEKDETETLTSEKVDMMAEECIRWINELLGIDMTECAQLINGEVLLALLHQLSRGGDKKEESDINDGEDSRQWKNLSLAYDLKKPSEQKKAHGDVQKFLSLCQDAFRVPPQDCFLPQDLFALGAPNVREDSKRRCEAKIAHTLSTLTNELPEDAHAKLLAPARSRKSVDPRFEALDIALLAAKADVARTYVDSVNEDRRKTTETAPFVLREGRTYKKQLSKNE